MATPVSSQPDGPTIPSGVILKASRAAIGVVGFGTLLYAIGFASIRAHYSFLGVSPGSIESQEITDEGGRFLYNLLFLPARLFEHIGWLQTVALLVAPPAIVFLEPWVRGRFQRTHPASESLRARTLRLVAIAAAVLVTAILVETLWRTLQIKDLLFSHDLDVTAFRSEASRSALYLQILWRLGAVTAIAMVLSYRVWRRGELVERILVVTQFLLAGAGLAAWPMVYGKLVISDLRPLILDAGGKTPQERKFLVRKEGKNCIIWNKSQQRLEILSLGDNQPLLIGPKEHLLE